MSSTATTDSVVTLMRQVFRRYASGVMLITYRDGEGTPFGMTATSVCSVSIDPPTILACVNRNARTHAEIVSGKRFAISLLAQEQRHIAEFCSAVGFTKHLKASWIADLPDSVPVVRGSLGSVQCRLAQKHTAGTHSILVGSVVSVDLGPPGDPLMYFDGAYRSIKEVEEELSCSERAGIIW